MRVFVKNEKDINKLVERLKDLVGERVCLSYLCSEVANLDIDPGIDPKMNNVLYGWDDFYFDIIYLEDGGVIDFGPIEYLGFYRIETSKEMYGGDGSIIYKFLCPRSKLGDLIRYTDAIRGSIVAELTLVNALTKFGFIKSMEKAYNKIFRNLKINIQKTDDPVVDVCETMCDNVEVIVLIEREDNNDSFDSVAKPSHYTEGRIYEPRKVIRDWRLNFNLGNAVKYISRAGRKNDKLEDLRKAKQYLEFEIEELEKEEK